MKIFRSIFAFFLLTVLFFSCSDEKNKNESTANLSFKEKQFGKTFENCDSTKDCTSIYFYYPVFENETNNQVINSINDFVMTKLLYTEIEPDSGATLENIVNYFIEDYELQLEDFPEYDIPWYNKTQVSVAFQDEKHITFKLSNESYTGGAHPNSLVNYFVINKSTGKEVFLNEIFKPNFEKTLNDVVARKFRKVRNITSNKSLGDEGFWFEEGQNIFNDNFGLTNDGIFFYYNPYDVAPYSFGPTLVEVPFSEIDSITNL